MKLDRRDVIKGLVLTGVSGMINTRMAAGMTNAAGRFGVAPRAATVHVLVAGSAHDAPFLEGASTSARRLGVDSSILRLKSSLFDDFAQVESLLRTRQPIVALLQPSDAILLEELARGNALRLSFIGRHTVGGSDWALRHHLTTFAQSAGLGTCLLSELGKQSLYVSEIPMGVEVAAPRPAAGFESYRVSTPHTLALHLSDLSVEKGCAALGISGAPVEHMLAHGIPAAGSTQPWATRLGSSLVRVACGNWRPTASGRQAFLARGNSGAGRPENLTSILIQG